MGRRRNVTRIISIRCDVRDCAALAKLCDASRLQPSAAARFSMRCISLCDFDASLASEFNVSLNAAGKEFNAATHKLNLASRFLLAPQEDPHSAYLRAVACLTQSVELYESVESSLTLTSGAVRSLFESLVSSRLIYVPGKLPIGDEKRRLNFRVDESDAEELDRLATALGVTRTLIVRAILNFVANGDLEFGDRCVLFNDVTMKALNFERKRWAANLSQAQEVVPTIIRNYSRRRQTPMKNAIEVNALLTRVSSQSSQAFSAMAALASPVAACYRGITDDDDNLVSDLISSNLSLCEEGNLDNA